MPAVRAWEKPFLRRLAKDGNVSAAAKHAKITRQAAYHAKGLDEVFSKAWDEALEKACDKLERVAFKLATKGEKKGIFHKGVLVATERRISTAVLMRLLEAHRPTKYRRGQEIDLNVSGITERAVRFRDPNGSNEGSSDVET